MQTALCLVATSTCLFCWFYWSFFKIAVPAAIESLPSSDVNKVTVDLVNQHVDLLSKAQVTLSKSTEQRVDSSGNDGEDQGGPLNLPRKGTTTAGKKR